MKNLIIFIPSIEGGGVEKNLILLSNYLSSKIENISVVTANNDIKNLFSKKVKIICPKTNFWNNKNRFIKTLVSILFLFKIKKKNSIIFSLQSNITAILISKFFGCKILIRLNTSLGKYINNFYRKVFFGTIYELADEIIVNSKNFQHELKKKLNLKSSVIYNPINPLKSSKKQLTFFKKFNGLKILSIGRLTDQKDHMTLLKSLNLLTKRNIKYRCCIIGRGHKKQELQNYINKNKMRKLIQLSGYIRNAENYMHFSDLFVLSSKYEGLPNVLIEAQKNSLPIISSNCMTGPKEILLDGKLGHLFQVGNYNDLFNKIILFIKNKKILTQKSDLAKKFIYRFDHKFNCEKYATVLMKFL